MSDKAARHFTEVEERGLENNMFANAANLAADGQLAAVARWLRTL